VLPELMLYVRNYRHTTFEIKACMGVAAVSPHYGTFAVYRASRDNLVPPKMKIPSSFTHLMSFQTCMT